MMQKKRWQASKDEYFFCYKLRKSVHVYNFLLDLLFSRELRNNQIPSIPVGWLDSFKNLRQLYLHNNLITSLGANLFKELKNLEILELQRNRISVIEPGAFNNLVNLYRLYLYDNQIEFLLLLMRYGPGKTELRSGTDSPGGVAIENTKKTNYRRHNNT